MPEAPATVVRIEPGQYRTDEKRLLQVVEAETEDRVVVEDVDSPVRFSVTRQKLESMRVVTPATDDEVEEWLKADS